MIHSVETFLRSRVSELGEVIGVGITKKNAI